MKERERIERELRDGWTFDVVVDTEVAAYCEPYYKAMCEGIDDDQTQQKEWQEAAIQSCQETV